MIEEIDHTADLAYKVVAENLEELFKDALVGFFKLIISNFDSIEKKIEEEIYLEDEEIDFLLHKFLEEVLYKLEVEGKVFKDCDIKIDKVNKTYKLLAKLYGDYLDRNKYDLLIIPKAITWNNFRVERENNKFKAYIVIDV